MPHEGVPPTRTPKSITKNTPESLTRGTPRRGGIGASNTGIFGLNTKNPDTRGGLNARVLLRRFVVQVLKVEVGKGVTQKPTSTLFLYFRSPLGARVGVGQLLKVV